MSLAAAPAALKSFDEIPVIDWEAMQGVSPYDFFRDLRAKTPLVKVPMGMGAMTLSLRARNAEQIAVQSAVASRRLSRSISACAIDARMS